MARELLNAHTHRDGRVVKRVLLLLPLLLISALVLQDGLEAPAPSSADGEVIPGRYIVLLEPGTDRARAARDLDVDVRAFYGSAVSGFSAEMSAERAAEIAESPSVALVEPVRRVRIALHENAFQTLIEGVDRVDLDENAAAGVGLPAGPDVDADIAIIDTGIDLDHPDLNALPGFGAYEARLPDDPETGFPVYGDCNTASDPEDEHGHGTHVAGTAGAIDNEIGVVGTAPGARLWAVRVLRDDGFGCDEDVLLGIDWVTERKMEFDESPGDGDGDPGINFTVANMSLGGDPSPVLCVGIANSVAAGVMYAVAAGNDAAAASVRGPADCADVVTVSAFADYDGQPGGLAANVFVDRLRPAASGRRFRVVQQLRSAGGDCRAGCMHYVDLLDVAGRGVRCSQRHEHGHAARSGRSRAVQGLDGLRRAVRRRQPDGGAHRRRLDAAAEQRLRLLRRPGRLAGGGALHGDLLLDGDVYAITNAVSIADTD